MKSRNQKADPIATLKEKRDHAREKSRFYLRQAKIADRRSDYVKAEQFARDGEAFGTKADALNADLKKLIEKLKTQKESSVNVVTEEALPVPAPIAVEVDAFVVYRRRVRPRY